MKEEPNPSEYSNGEREGQFKIDTEYLIVD